MFWALASTSGLLYVVIWFFLDWYNGGGWVVSVVTSGDLTIGGSVGYLLATTPDLFRRDIVGLSAGRAGRADRHLLTRLTVRERRPPRRGRSTEAALLLASVLGQLVVWLSVNGDRHRRIFTEYYARVATFSTDYLGK